MAIYSCGQCGAPCDENGKQLESIPENYNPEQYEHIWCNNCEAREREAEMDFHESMKRWFDGDGNNR